MLYSCFLVTIPLFVAGSIEIGICMPWFNLNIVGKLILPGLLGSSAWSAVIAVVVGGVIGSIIGLIKRKLRYTVLPAIAGCFLGTMLICMMPILSTPGIVGGGAYGGIVILMIAVYTLPVGAIGGAIAGSVVGLSLSQARQRKLGLRLFVLTYGIMALVIYTSVTFHCIRPNQTPMYCAEAGFQP